MTITVDINVVLDVFQKREVHYAASAQVLGLVGREPSEESSRPTD